MGKVPLGPVSTWVESTLTFPCSSALWGALPDDRHSALGWCLASGTVTAAVGFLLLLLLLRRRRRRRRNLLLLLLVNFRVFPPFFSGTVACTGNAFYF